MTLLTQTQQIDRELANLSDRLAAHTQNAALAVSEMALCLLRLPPHVLADWLNSKTPDQIQLLFSEHFIAGSHANGLTGVVARTIGATIDPVDVSDFASKAAARNLLITADETGWHVTTITQPEPEQQAE